MLYQSNQDLLVISQIQKCKPNITHCGYQTKLTKTEYYSLNNIALDKETLRITGSGFSQHSVVIKYVTLFMKHWQQLLGHNNGAGKVTLRNAHCVP